MNFSDLIEGLDGGFSFETCGSSISFYKTGGPIGLYVEPNSIDALNELINRIKEKGIPFRIIGSGSNVLISDRGFDGIIINLGRLNSIYAEQDYFVVEAGSKLDDVVSIFSAEGLGDLTNLSGIPGTIGGAVYMNAGAFGSEMKDFVTSVTVIDEQGCIIKMDNSECAFGYREAPSLKNKIIVSINLRLKLSDPLQLVDKREKIISRREQKQPLDFPSCGSVFKRPTNNFAGKLIELCELKGTIYGGAKISKKHANFILNYNDASSKDIYELISLAQKKVSEEHGIKLECEVQFIGF